MEELRVRFRFGKWRVVYNGYGEYLGRTIRQLENYEVRVDMERYICEKLRPVMLSKVRLRDGDDAELSEKEITMLRGAAGSLLVGQMWLQPAPCRCRGGPKLQGSDTSRSRTR